MGGDGRARVTRSIPEWLDSTSRAIGSFVERVEPPFAGVLSAPAFLVGLLFRIPLLGTGLKWIWNVVLTVAWGAASLPDAGLGLAGVLPEKRLRVSVLLLCGPGETGLSTEGIVSGLVAQMEQAAEILRRQAQVRLVPAGRIGRSSIPGTPSDVDRSWVKVVSAKHAAGMLDVGCNWRAVREELGVSGSRFEAMAAKASYHSQFRRVLGYGSPVFVFAVRSIRGFEGCSLGPLTDYVTVDRASPLCLAHEIGHACNLPHHRGDSANLMDPHNCAGKLLTRSQAVFLRMSRHVTYF